MAGGGPARARDQPRVGGVATSDRSSRLSSWGVRGNPALVPGPSGPAGSSGAHDRPRTAVFGNTQPYDLIVSPSDARVAQSGSPRILAPPTPGPPHEPGGGVLASGLSRSSRAALQTCLRDRRSARMAPRFAMTQRPGPRTVRRSLLGRMPASRSRWAAISFSCTSRGACERRTPCGAVCMAFRVGSRLEPSARHPFLRWRCLPEDRSGAIRPAPTRAGKMPDGSEACCQGVGQVSAGETELLCVSDRSWSPGGRAGHRPET